MEQISVSGHFNLRSYVYIQSDVKNTSEVTGQYNIYIKVQNYVSSVLLRLQCLSKITFFMQMVTEQLFPAVR